MRKRIETGKGSNQDEENYLSESWGDSILAMSQVYFCSGTFVCMRQVSESAQNLHARACCQTSYRYPIVLNEWHCVAFPCRLKTVQNTYACYRIRRRDDFWKENFHPPSKTLNTTNHRKGPPHFFCYRIRGRSYWF